MKQKILKALALGLLLTGGVNGAWAGDFIDDATAVSVHFNSTENTPTINTVDGKKQLVFTPVVGEFQMKFTLSDYTLNAGQMFTLVELSGNLNTSGNHKARKLTIAGTEYENTDNTNWVTFTVGEHTIAIMSPLSSDATWRAKYVSEVDNTMTASFANVILAASAATETTVYRCGMYTLGEILELYPALKTNNFQLNDSYRLLNDASTAFGSTFASSKTNNGTDNGQIETKNAAITTLAGVKLWCKAIDFAKIPTNYRCFWLRFLQPAEATTEDLFADLHSDAILMPNMSNNFLAKMPTMHPKIIDFDRKMQNTTFVDGVAPASAITIDGQNLGQSTTANWATYSRELKAGYNSCAMPFKKIANASDVPAGITFYKVSTLSDSKIVFDKISNPTVDNCFTTGTDWTPVIIHAETAGVYTFVGRDAITNWTDITYKSKKVGNSGDEPNCIYWVGSFVDGVPTGDYASSKNYGISSDGTKFLKMAADTKTTYYRAFIADKRTAGAPELTLSFNDGNGTTDIVQLKDVHGLTQEDGAVYNLQGVRMTGSNLPAGIYVKNGKKYVVK